MDKVKLKNGFGITEVLISAVVLGLLYMAILHMQTGNREAMLRIRGRDGAVEVAQQVIDSLNRIGISSIPDISTPPGDYSDDETDGDNYIWHWQPISRSWDRGVGAAGDKATIEYTPVVTVMPTTDYTATSESSLENVSHVYAKQVNVEVSWQFKGSTQSINMSTVIR